MHIEPGSFGWLVGHDLRLAWRSFTGLFDGWSKPSAYAATVIALVCLHTMAWGALSMRASFPSATGSTAVTLALVGLFAWMVAQGVLGATRQLYERGHVDVLFSSPLPAWMAVASRALAITAGSLGSLAPLVLPIANVGAVVETPHWLLVYPILAALALGGTAAGFLLAIGLFFTVGAKRARLYAQIAAALLGGGLILGVQIASLLPKDMTLPSWPAGEATVRALTDWSAVAADNPIIAVAVTSVCALAIFVLAVAALTGAFVRATHLAAGASAPTSSSRSFRRPFREGVFASLRRKEWRLLVRDPNVFAQLGLQIIYTLPIAVFLLRSPEEIPPAVALAPLVVVLAAQISASLSWITVSGEDAPELIASAPITQTGGALAKLSAVAAPLLIILAMPLAVLFMISPLALAYALVFAAGAAISTALLNFWHPMPGNRRGLLRRHSQSKVIAIAEHGLALLWAIAIVTAFVDARIATVPLGLILGVLIIFRPKPTRRQRTAVAAVQNNLAVSLKS